MIRDMRMQRLVAADKEPTPTPDPPPPPPPTLALIHTAHRSLLTFHPHQEPIRPLLLLLLLLPEPQP